MKLFEIPFQLTLNRSSIVSDWNHGLFIGECGCWLIFSVGPDLWCCRGSYRGFRNGLNIHGYQRYVLQCSNKFHVTLWSFCQPMSFNSPTGLSRHLEGTAKKWLRKRSGVQVRDPHLLSPPSFLPHRRNRRSRDNVGWYWVLG